jgi:ABC-type dipeptide/oligopeptide/nickel transport system permease subunit
MSMATQNDVARARREGELFGIPLGDLGWFQSLLMGLATGMAAFFLTTFAAIVVMLAYQTVTQRVPPYQMAYRAVGFPVGIVVMALALSFLGVQWSRRMVRKSRKA